MARDPRGRGAGVTGVVDGAAPVVLLGGGLTGISTALHLGQPWVLLERESRLGGHARTVERDGHFFDVTGHWLHLRDPKVQSLVEEILPGQMHRVERRARIWSHGRTTHYPFQANLHGLPQDVIDECVAGVLAVKDAIAQPAEPRNFEEYCLRHFGAGISRHFMVPYNEKLWGVHPREITAAWCSRFVPLPNVDQILAGARGDGPAAMGYNVSFLHPRQGGIETFTRALAGRLQGGRVVTGTDPERIDWRARAVVVGGERIPYRALVSSIPLPELLKRMPGLPSEIEEHAARLRCTTLTYLNVATRSAPPADWHWAYVPERRWPFYRVGIFSNATPSMAPPGCGSLYVELAARGPFRPESLPDVAAGLTAMGAIAAPGDIRFADPVQIQYAYVVFDEHYYPATAAIFRFLEDNAIYPRGRYGAWTYNAMEDCVIAGRDTAAIIDSRHGDPS